MNTSLLLAAYDRMTSSNTACPLDRAIAMIVLNSAKQTGLFEQVKPMILNKRSAWLDWVSITQRQWQRHTRRPSRARHHDSIALRTKYVECK